MKRNEGFGERMEKDYFPDRLTTTSKTKKPSTPDKGPKVDAVGIKLGVYPTLDGFMGL